MINKSILIGNLGKDPEVRRLENGTTVAKFSLATSESYKDKSGEWQTITQWHDIVCWRQLAERAESQLKKGQRVYVEGKTTYRKYQDKDGNDRKVTEIVANTFRLLERREESQQTTPQQQTANAQTTAPVTQPVDNSFPDSDLPF